MKSITWSPQGSDHSISLFHDFLTFNSGFRILGPLVGSTSFVETFVVEVLHEDLGIMFSFLMFANLHVAFVMFLLCYA
jgi:hypothetical protein